MLLLTGKAAAMGFPPFFGEVGDQINVETVDFASCQRLVGLQVPLDILRVSESVKYADEAHLFGGAAKHAPVCGIDRALTALELGDSDPEFGTFEHRTEFCSLSRMASSNGRRSEISRKVTTEPIAWPLRKSG
jgi:hypothetical protein